MIEYILVFLTPTSRRTKFGRSFSTPSSNRGELGAGDLLGTWDGEKKIQKRRRTSAGGKKPIQQHPNSRGVIVRRSRAPEGHSAKPKFINKPLSNFDLLKWIDFLKIPNFKGIFARDELRPREHSPASSIWIHSKMLELIGFVAFLDASRPWLRLGIVPCGPTIQGQGTLNTTLTPT